MKSRILVAVVGLPLLLLILVWAPSWAAMLLMMALCAVGAYELMHAVAGGRAYLPMVLSIAMGVSVCAMIETRREGLFLPYAFGFVTLLFLFAIVHYGKESAVRFSDLTAALFAGLVFPLMLSCLLRLRLLDQGEAFVLVPLAVSFGTDTFALFAGMLFGKHKLAPAVSPKKTVEGAVGGLLGGVIGMLLFQWIAGPLAGISLSCSLILILGLAGSVLGQIGDLAFSAIKRESGIKDYGKLLPGHGGVLDRFDSVTFVAPFVWLVFAFGNFV